MNDRWQMRDPAPRGGPGYGRPPGRPGPPPPRRPRGLSWRYRGPESLEIGPGWPWPAVSLAALVAGVVLAWIGLGRGGLTGELFPIGFCVVCVVAVCAVRGNQVLVPAVQPPVIATGAILGAAIINGKTTSTTSLLLAVVAPLAELFWWLALATAACVLIGAVRAGLTRRVASRLADGGR